MNNINLFTKEELESQKLAEITDHYNVLAKLIGLKAVKKFRDKPTSVSRTLDAQETYREDLEAAVKAEIVAKTKVLPPQKELSSNWGKIASQKTALQGKGVKPKKEKSDTPNGVRQNKFGLSDDSIVTVVKGEPKEGSIEDSLFIAINQGCSTVKQIVDYIVANHTRPRSGEAVDAAYALHNIKWFIKKGHLKVS